MPDIPELGQWPAELHRCPICDGKGIKARLSIIHGGRFDGVQASCETCDFLVQSSHPDALRLTLEMFAEGGKALADSMENLSGDVAAQMG